MLLKRIGYFLVGASISSVGVYFFWQKKNATFDYGMDARTLKTIRIKKRAFSDNALRVMQNSDIDTLKISKILFTGDVDFSQSKPRQKPCGEYFVTGNNELANVSLYVKRCDSLSTIEKIIID